MGYFSFVYLKKSLIADKAKTRSHVPAVRLFVCSGYSAKYSILSSVRLRVGLRDRQKYLLKEYVV